MAAVDSVKGVRRQRQSKAATFDSVEGVRRSTAVDGGNSQRLRSTVVAVKGMRRQRQETATAAGGDDGDSGRWWPGMMIYFIRGGGEQCEYYLTLYCSFI